MSDRTHPASSVAREARTEGQILTSELDRQEDKFCGILPSTIRWQDFRNAFLVAVQTNPKLLAADRSSLFLALQKAASDGLKPDGREGALVIFNEEDEDGNRKASYGPKKVVWMPMVAGIIKTLRNAAFIKAITVECVYRDEQIEVSLGDNPTIIHRRSIDPDFDDDPANIIGVYAIVSYMNGAIEREWMSRKQIMRVQAVSRARKGPWGPWWDEQARKTVLRRLSKRLEKSPEVTRMALALERDETLGPETIDGESVETAAAPALAEPKTAAPKQSRPALTADNAPPVLDLGEKRREREPVTVEGKAESVTFPNQVIENPDPPIVGVQKAKKEPEPDPQEEPAADGFWAVDEHGECDHEPMTVAGFVDWFEKITAKTDNLEAIKENNADAIADAAEFSGIYRKRINAAIDFAIRRLAPKAEPEPARQKEPTGPRSTDAAKLTSFLLDDIAKAESADDLRNWKTSQGIAKELEYLRSIPSTGSPSFVRCLRVYDERMKKLSK